MVKNLEYLACFPLNSKNPPLASDTKLMKDIAFTKIDVGCGKKNLCKASMPAIFFPPFLSTLLSSLDLSYKKIEAWEMR